MSIDPKIENIRPLVASGNIMVLLSLYTIGQIQITRTQYCSQYCVIEGLFQALSNFQEQKLPVSWLNSQNSVSQRKS